MFGRDVTTPTFGARVRQARLELAARRGREVSQSAVARHLGVVPSTVQRWENGGKPPELDVVAQLAAFLHVSPAWLAFGEGEAHPTTAHATARTERPRAALPPLEEPEVIESRHEPRASHAKRGKRAG
jgi:transcriptional regulator with XRE-family HTH domain